MNKVKFGIAVSEVMSECDEFMRKNAIVDKDNIEESMMANELVYTISRQAREDFVSKLFHKLFSDERVFEAIRENAIIPKRSTKSSACYDFVAPQNVTIPAGGFATVETGICAKFPEDEALMIYSRSGMGFKHGIVLVNGTAIIDADYYGNPTNGGEIIVGLRNLSDTDYSIRAGEKIAQGMFIEYGLTDDDDANGDRVGGLGSTGK